MLTEMSSAVATIAFGPSQYGKSSLIATLMQDADPQLRRPKMGTGRGTSVTRRSETFITCLGLVQDNAGYNDTRLWTTPSIIHRQAALDLAYHHVDRVRFLVFESLSADSMQLRVTIEQLIETFGENIKESIVIVATKADRVDQEELEERCNAIMDAMLDIGIGDQLILWQNKLPEPMQATNQLQNLREALQRTVLTNTRELNDIQTKINVRAQQLFDEQEPSDVVKSVQVCDMVEEINIVDITYEEQIYKKVCVKEGYKMLVERDSLPVRIAGGFLYVATRGVGAAAELTWRELNRPQFEWRSKMVKKTRKEPQPRMKERIVWKDVKVPCTKPLDAFVDTARTEVLNDLRGSLMSSV